MNKFDFILPLKVPSLRCLHRQQRLNLVPKVVTVRTAGSYKAVRQVRLENSIISYVRGMPAFARFFAAQMFKARVKRAVVGLGVLAIVALCGFTLLSPYKFVFGTLIPNEVLTKATDGAPLRVALWEDNALRNGLRLPGAVFVHGLTRNGPQEPAYAMLCAALARRGLIVAAPWLRGYDSEKSLNLGKNFMASRWNPLPDVGASFALLQNHPRVDAEKIVVIGHSLGGGYGLLFGLSESRVAGIISFSRLDMEGRLRHWPGYFDRFRLEVSKTFGLHTAMSVDAFQEFADAQIFAFERAKAQLNSERQSRLLFAIGGAERLSDRQWLVDYSEHAGDATEYHEFPELSHWLNFRGFKGIGVYNRETIDHVASTLARWIQARPI